jgi:hypothetical protein
MTDRMIDLNQPQLKRQPAEQAPRKASFDDIYNAPDPGPYFTKLRPLDYRTPHFAQPVIRRTIAELRALRARERITMLDLCSGYGVNGALQKFGMSLDDLYRFYATGGARTPESDRAALAPRRRDGQGLRVIGQDVAGKAIAYAKAVGFADDILHANLETDDLSEAQEDLVASTDLLTITGGLSYIGEATLQRVLGALRRPPWVLYFPMRCSDTEAVNDTLREAGLRPAHWPKPLPQRRFADERERLSVRAAIEQCSDGMGPASPTHHQAVLYLARPADESRSVPITSLITGLATPLLHPATADPEDANEADAHRRGSLN